MDYRKIIDELLLDKENFDRYLDFQKYIKIDVFTLEDNLFSDFNLSVFKSDPYGYESLYLLTVPQKIHAFVSYFAFCRYFKLFPFDKEKLANIRKCKNCAYVTHNQDNDLFCLENMVNDSYVCSDHVFALNDYKEIFEVISGRQR